MCEELQWGGGGLSLQAAPRIRARSRTLDKLWGVLQRGFKRPDHLASSRALLALAVCRKLGAVPTWERSPGLGLVVQNRESCEMALGIGGTGTGGTGGSLSNLYPRRLVDKIPS